MAAPPACERVGAVSRIESFEGGVERFHMARALAGRPLYWTSVYRVGGALVDSGCSSARPVFARWLRERAPEAVLTTHEHEDHIGNHALLAGVPVHAPPLAAQFLARGHPPFPSYRRFVWGYHEAAPGARPVDGRVVVGDRTFRVFQVNGHSADHVAYLDEREQGLFSGDAYMGKFKAARLEEDVLTEVRTLRRMADLDPAVLYPAHGPVIPRPRARLVEVAEHFEGLWRLAWAHADRGMKPARIAREIVGREPAISFISMGEFSTTKLVLNLLRQRPT